MRTQTLNLLHAVITLAAFSLATAPAVGLGAEPGPPSAPGPSPTRLPPPRQDGAVSLEAALAARRSVRNFADQPLALQELSQLLWAAQGITHANGYRTAPSAGALYPLEISVVAGLVADLAAGIYRYHPAGHQLLPVAPGDRRPALADAALGQSAIRKAPVVIAITGIYRKSTVKYGERGVRYVHFEAGHAAQNLCLEATALGLGTVVIGAFADQEVAALLQVSGQVPLYLIPVGRK